MSYWQPTFLLSSSLASATPQLSSNNSTLRLLWLSTWLLCWWPQLSSSGHPSISSQTKLKYHLVWWTSCPLCPTSDWWMFGSFLYNWSHFCLSSFWLLWRFMLMLMRSIIMAEQGSVYKWYESISIKLPDFRKVDSKEAFTEREGKLLTPERIKKMLKIFGNLSLTCMPSMLNLKNLF